MDPARPSTATEPAQWQVVHLHPEAPSKPVFGAPCNGCGVCCLVEPCPVGMVVSRRRRGACVALRWDAAQSRYLCGMVSAPQDVLGLRWQWLSPWVARAALRWIAAGVGCDARLDIEKPATGRGESKV